MRGLVQWAPILALMAATGCAKPPDVQKEVAASVEPTADSAGYIFGPDEGEVLVPCRPGSSPQARWIIKTDPATTGSANVAMGTQELPAGEQIPMHRHEGQDEILFIHKGRPTGVIGDSSAAIGPGTTVYVPRGIWHGVRNTESETATIAWVVVPPGLENYFRAIGAPPGTECAPLPPDELAEIQRRHGITVRVE